MINVMDFVNCAPCLASTSTFFGRAWQGMSYKPIIQTIGKAEVRCQPVRLLAALGACFLFHAYLIPLTNGSVPDVSQSPRALQTDSSPRLVVSPSHDTGTSHEPLVRVVDSLVCVETEDLDSLEEDPGHPQAFPEQSLIRVGESSSHDSPRAPFLPFLAIHGLMSRRF
jgi:hypothetical protein